MTINVGDVVQLKKPLLGNQKNALGICYEKYRLIEPGWSFIFQNGNYDGFCEWEVRKFLRVVGHVTSVEDYRFSNVMQLSRDFSKFETAIRIWKIVNQLK